MRKIDISDAPEKSRIVNDSELLKHVTNVHKAKREGRKMGLGVIKHGITVLGAVTLGTVIAGSVLSFLGVDPSFLIDLVKIFIGAVGVLGVGVIGFSKSSSD